MEFTSVFSTVDLHTGGEPLRVVLSGLPPLPGRTILEKRAYAQTHHDDVRRLLMLEPRGHADMYGAYLTPPVTEGADFGIIFTHNEGYSSMCGHGVIAVATLLVANHMIRREVPETRVGLDSPAGFIEAFVGWDGRRVGEVRFRNVPSFLVERDLEVHTPSFGAVTVDLAFGGAFYAYLDAEQVGLEVRPHQYGSLITLGHEVKVAVEAGRELVHPLEPGLRGLYGTIVAGAPHHPGADQANVCIFADREVDRSPTGTGTAGRVAQLHARGLLAPGQELVNESIIGTRMVGRVLEEAQVGPYPAVIPEVRGRASIMGFNQWVVAPDDELPGGFLLR